MCILVFLPGQESFIGLWQPTKATPWHVQPVVRAAGEGNRILQGVEACLQANHITLKNITHIGVMHGPTTYTELRLFVTTANTLAWSLHLPLFSFGPDVEMPDALPSLVATAKVNVPVNPVYPHEL